MEFRDSLMRVFLEDAQAWGGWEPPDGLSIDDVVAAQDWHPPHPTGTPDTAQKAVPTPDHVTIMRHAVGLDHPTRDRPWRNRYMISKPRQDWEVLVASGLAKREKQPSRIVYRVTIKGAQAVIRDGETIQIETFGDLT